MYINTIAYGGMILHCGVTMFRHRRAAPALEPTGISQTTQGFALLFT